MRIVQISDTHLSRDKPHFLENWAPLAAWIADQHPDLVIHTGDVTFDGAGVEVDLSYAAQLMDELGIRWRGTRHHDEVDAVAFGPPDHSVEDRGRPSR
jgi:3',5'-cyclic AMP phosphodiesterase CpdA